MLRRVTSKATATATVGMYGLIRHSRAGRPILTINNVGTPAPITRRCFAATSREKRSLNSKQIKGEASRTATATAAKTQKTSTSTSNNTAAAYAAAPGNVSGGGGAGTGAVLGLLAIGGGGAAAAYYNDILPDLLGDSPPKHQNDSTEKKKTPPQAVAAVVKEKTSPQAVAAAVVKKKEDTNNADKRTTMSVEQILPAKEVEELKESLAEASVEEPPPAVVIAEVVTEEVDSAVPAMTAAEKKAAKKKAKKEKALLAIVTEENSAVATPAAMATTEPQTTIAVKSSIPTSSSSLDGSKIMAEIEELKKELHKQSDKALTEAHTELAKLTSMDVMSQELDFMTSSQLKVRLVQMAKDLEERTKWEAVRLQEFMSMKEKEVEDRYVLLIKKLRLEAEHLQEEKITRQKKALTAEAEEVLKEQQTRSDVFLENSLKIQEKAHEEDKAAFETKTEEAMSAKYEELYGNSLTKMKDEFATKMNQRTKQMETLSKKLSDLELSLKSSQDFQVGSLQAHRITAAAIALTEKLESGEPSGAAVNALKAVASDNAVVSAAVQALPESVSNSGISTVQELQAGFEEKVYPQCRRAANVPEGQDGLEGQLLGSIFSALKSPPGPDEAAPETEKDESEYVLSRARRHVKLGELDKAVIELKKLKGQAAYTANDWEARAKDRVAVEKALKVIRMECALANENLSKVAAA